MQRTRLLLTTALTIAAGASFAQTGAPVEQGEKNVPEFEPAFEAQTRAPALASDVELATSTLATGLTHPWGLAILPGDQGYLVTERSGTLRHISENGSLSDPVAGVPEVKAEEQGGLLDVALGPDFAETRHVYLTYAKPITADTSATAAARGVLSDDMTELTEVMDIFIQTPASTTPMHYGSRIVFDDAGHAFITTGEHFTRAERVKAQDLEATYGKVVRVNLDGSLPEGNPFIENELAVDEIWTLGHRNIQGAAVRPSTGQLWIVEHGPAGGDELNVIEPGTNYGWPVVSYGEKYDGNPVGSGSSDHEAQGFTEPRYYWDPVIAPGDMTFYQGDIFADWKGDVLIASLVPGGMVRLELDGQTVTGEARYLEDLGRVRDVDVDQDGSILLLTDFDEGSVIRVMPEGMAN